MNQDNNYPIKRQPNKLASKSTSTSSMPRSTCSNSSTVSDNDKNSNFKVYSHYVQPNLDKQNTNKITHTNNEQHIEIKKPKLAESYIVNKKADKFEKHSQEQIDLINSLEDSFMRSFIGINTFQSENIFIDLINKELLLICLQNKKSENGLYNFCFKGRCSIALVHGSIQTNGYVLKNSNKLKWYDLYSPESNSFLSISNNQEVSTEDAFQQDQKIIFTKIKTYFDLENDNSVDQSLNEFLAKNHCMTSSIFAMRPLKSQLCNYLCFFENFQHIYQSLSNLSTSKNENKIFKPENSNQMNQNSEFDNLIAKFDIFPVPLNFFNAVHSENEDEKSVIEKITNYSSETQVEVNSNDLSPVIMACGGKDVGKSTFLRYLINSLLNTFQKVAYLDCDPGQCEFTLGSCLSLTLISEPLFGPPHTHINHSDSNKKCYLLGHLSPNDVPGLYLKYLNQCHQDFFAFKSSLNKSDKIPLIVNTMGWNQGLGLCLLKESILLFKPTHIIQINHPVEANKNMPTLDIDWLKTADGWPSSRSTSSEFKKDFQPIQTQKNVSLTKQNDQMDVDSLENDFKYQLIVLKSKAPYKSSKFTNQVPQKRLSPRDHRNIAIITYFSKLHENTIYFKPVHHLKPYKISWSKLALHVTHTRVDYDQFFRIFNASLVSLSRVEDKFIKKKEENLELPGYLNFNNKKEPIITCLGFGIVRGINMETKEFYILTPEPVEILNQVNLLCKGMLNLPLEFFYEQDSETPCPYMSYSDNLQTRTNNLNAISNEPIQRKYLIHQTQNKKF